MSACCQTNQEPVLAATSCCGGAGDAELARSAREWLRLGLAGLVAGQAMIFGLAVNLSPVSGTARWIIHGALAISAVAVFLLAGLPILRESWRGLRSGRVVFEQLFLLGIFGAFAASVHSSITGEGHVYYEVVAILVAIYTFGTLLARRRREALEQALRRMGDEFDACELITPCGGLRTVPVAEIRPGDEVMVAPHAGIPVDGTVTGGTALVSEMALTGEPHPVVKRTGDAVLAGSRVEDSALRIRAVSAGRSRRLDALLASVAEARRRPCTTQREADRLVAWFLPAVMVVAVLTTVGWTLHSGWITGVFNGLAVLLVACPCSMGLATPVAIWSALGALARRGLIARSGDAIEALARVDTVVFDKTGTLSEETARLVDFVVRPGVDREELRRQAGALQTASHHPVARALREGLHAPEEPAREVRILPGTGLEGRVAGGSLLQAGNSSLLQPEDAADAAALRAQLITPEAGGHEIFLRRDGRLCGLAILRETLRASAPEAVQRLDTMGLDTIVMTGDRAENAARFGFRHCLAGLTPAGKLEEVRALKAAGRTVLFTGDGINDAPAMAEVPVSIALASGSGLPRETASMEFLGQDLRAIPQAVALARATTGSIRRNLLFAACYNLAGITLAAAGWLDPVVAALLMLVSSMTVTWRVLRETQDGGLERLAFRPSRPRKQAVRGLPRWERLTAGAALALQGPVLAWLGGFGAATAAGFTVLFGLAGLLAAFGSRGRAWTPPARMTLAMVSLGGLAMLAGWWADAGFAAVVRDGACLCGCAKSNMGWGLLAQFTWMDGGMLLAALPGLFVGREAARAFPARLGCWLAGVAGMLLGMEAAAWVLAGLPVTAPGGQFFLTYAAMVTGMCGGMLVGCLAAEKLRRSGA